MNDTFDNFTFSEIITRPDSPTSDKGYKSGSQLLEEFDPETALNEENTGKNVSFDDTMFLENVRLSQLDEGTSPKSEITTKHDVSCKRDINTQENYFEATRSCRNASPSLDLLPSLPKTSTVDSNIFVKKKIDEQSQNLTKTAEDLSNLSSWKLPSQILDKYHQKGIKKLLPWQIECLLHNDVYKQSKSIVYSAPTSAGKTLVAELLLLKMISERKKKVIFILPYVSVVREKMFYFQEIFCGIRVEGFMGTYHPPGGFENTQLAVCTIEKANGIVNKLLENGNTNCLGTVVIDEMHLLGDPNRGYLLELLLTKIKYASEKLDAENDCKIQIIGMSATLPNLPILSKWLNAELYVTTFRPVPLHQQVTVSGKIYNHNLNLLRTVETLPDLDTDTDNVLQLCLETILDSYSVAIFCPTKNWCENLAQQMALAFWKLGAKTGELSEKLRQEIDAEKIEEVINQLTYCPVGLDSVLRKTVSFGVAFHHAGLTIDERDILERAFKNGALKCLVATSTLSSGVNLPARRVIIRTPIFHGKPLDVLTYQQMIGRAGRMGKDTMGESILVCQDSNFLKAKEIMSSCLEPIQSCLDRDDKLNRAILEIFSSDVAKCLDDIRLFAQCTLLSQQTEHSIDSLVNDTIDFLIDNEFLRLQQESGNYVPTPLAKACFSSSLTPEDGLKLFCELSKARQCFVLDTELHLVYLVTPYNACFQWGDLDWILYLNFWEKLPKCMKKVAELVGVRESFIVKQTRSHKSQNTRELLVHKRFFVALALYDLVNEVDLCDVAKKFKCNRGLLQSLQTSASTFAGMVTAFSRQLRWNCVEILVEQFQDRLQFGIGRDLLDLMRLPILTSKIARVLYDNGLETLQDVAKSDVNVIENILYKLTPFESKKQSNCDGDDSLSLDSERKTKMRNIWIVGREGLTMRETAELLLSDARIYLQHEMGFKQIVWTDTSTAAVENPAEKSSLAKDETSKNDMSNMSDLRQLDRTSNVKSDDSLFESSLDGHDDSLNSVIGSKLDNSRTRYSQFDSRSPTAATNNCLSNDDHVTKTPKRRLSKNNDLDDFNPLSPSKKLKTGTDNLNDTPDSKSQDERQNFTQLEMIDVCCDDSQILFDAFFEDIKQKPLISMALCYSTSDENHEQIVTEPHDSEEHDIKKLIGFAVAWDSKTAYYLSVEKFKNSLHVISYLSSKKNLIIRLSDTKKHTKLLRLLNNVQFRGDFEDPKICDWILQPQGKEKNLQEMAHFSLWERSRQQEFSINNCNRVSRKFLTGLFTKLMVYVAPSMTPTKTKDGFLSFIPGNPCMPSFMPIARKLLKQREKARNEITTLTPCIFLPINFGTEIACYYPRAAHFLQTYGVATDKENFSNSIDVFNTSNCKIKCCFEAFITWHLVDDIKQLLAEDNFHLKNILSTEMSCIKIISQMELDGIQCDQKKLHRILETLRTQISSLENEAYRVVGRRFSFSSSKDVRAVLKRITGKKGSSRKQFLEKNEHAIAKMVLEWRKLNYILSHNVQPLVRAIRNGKIHTSSIFHTVTGRVSMHEPNLQNVPKKFDLIDWQTKKRFTVNCREVFVPSDGDSCFLSADFCQVELRLLAHFSQDGALCEILRRNDGDAFRVIAAKWHDLTENEVSDELRHRTKQLCYGIIYGMGDKSLAAHLNIEENTAIDLIESFHKSYPGIEKFIRKTVEECQKNKFVETLGGRRRYLYRINDPLIALRAQAERQALNSTIQGSAADLMKTALIAVSEEFLRFNNNKLNDSSPKLVLHLHDEIIYEVPTKYSKEIARILKKSMENAVKLSIPFPVKIKSGPSWGQLTELIL